MAKTPFSAIALDLDFTAYKQRQCSQALRALASLTEAGAANDEAAPAPLRLDDLHALLSVIADQSMQLSIETQEHLKVAHKLCA